MTLVDNLENDFSFLGNDEANFYFRTDKGAPRGKIVVVNALEAKPVWKDIVPEAPETLGGVSFINNQFVLNYLKHASTNIKIYEKTGKFVRDVILPGIGSAGGFGGRRGDTETFYSYSSFNAPPTIYRYDMKTGKSELFRQAKVNIDPIELRGKAGILYQQGRDESADVHCPQKGAEARRQQPDDPQRLRRI